MRWGRAGMRFEEAREVSWRWKSQAVANSLDRQRGMEKEHLGFGNDPIGNPRMGRLAGVLLDDSPQIRGMEILRSRKIVDLGHLGGRPSKELPDSRIQLLLKGCDDA